MQAFFAKHISPRANMRATSTESISMVAHCIRQVEQHFESTMHQAARMKLGVGSERRGEKRRKERQVREEGEAEHELS